MFGVQDWAEVHRLNRQGVSKRAIARRLGMSHTTVHRLLGLAEPPRYERRRASSLLDPFADQIAAMLDADPKAPATVILQHLRRDGYTGGITILKERLAQIRPQFLAARSFQRTTYLPGEISQVDWWHTGRQVPVGKGATREAFGLVVTLPASAAHAAVFTFGRSVADLLPAALGCFERLCGVPEKVICDNDAAIVRERRGGVAILHDEVAAFFGQLGTKVVALRPGDPQAKGQVERTNGYLDRSFLPLRSSATSTISKLSTTSGPLASPIGAITVVSERSWPMLGVSSAGSCGRCPTRRPTRRATSRPGSREMASAASATSTTRFHPGSRDAASTSSPRRSRSWCAMKAVRSPDTAAAGSPPTS